MKKIVSFIFAALAAFVLFTACGEKKSGENVHVTVVDESGKPVAGVKVQACDDSACMVTDTNADGKASFAISKNVVDVHILKVPEGFAAVEEVFRTDDAGSLTITLKKE